MGDVYEFIVDGTSGVSPEGVDGSVIVAGVCSKGEEGKTYLLGKNSDLAGLLGVGCLTDRLMDVMAEGGQSPVVMAVPVTGSGGTTGEVTKTGSGPDITTAGEALAAADVTLEVLTSGARNAGTYRLSLDGDSWGAETTIPVDGDIACGDTGVTITVPEAAMVKGDVYRFTTTAPQASISAVLAALEQPLSVFDAEFVYVTGPSDAVDWAALSVKGKSLYNAHRPTHFICEARLPGEDEDYNDWVAALVSDSRAFIDRNLSVCGAFGEVSDITGRRLTRNWAGLQVGRTLCVPVNRSIGRVRDGAISCGSLPDELTDAQIAMLTKARFTMARRYAQLPGVYWEDALMMAAPTSDYQRQRTVRTAYKALRKMRIAGLKSINDELGDPAMEGGAAGISYLKSNLEGALDTMVKARPSELAGYVIEVPADQDIVNNGLAVETRLVGIPIIGTIKLFSSWYWAGSELDPRLS